MNSQKDYLIQKKPLSALLIFSIPMMLGNLFQQLYTLVDSAIVGRYVGEEALAACGASYALTMVLICIAIGGGVGASVVVSRYFGAKEYYKMRTAVNTALISFLFISVFLALILRLVSKPLMLLLKTPDDSYEMAVTYLNIYLYGLPFLFMYNVLNAMFNSLGKSKIPLFFLIFSSLLNVGLDLFMVITLKMSIAGAAWATFIAQGISAILSFFVLMRLMRSLSKEKTTVFDKTEFEQMVVIAVPSIIQQATVSIGMLLVQVVVNGFGSEALAGFTAATRISSICLVPMNAIGNAASAYTAQNLGAGKPERVPQGYSATNSIATGFAILICIVLQLFNRQLIGVFLDLDDATVSAITVGTGYLKFMGWFYCLMGYKQALDGLLRGAGDTKMFTIANIINLGIRVIGSFAFASVFGIAITWYVVPFGWAANWLISFYEYRTGKWRKMFSSFQKE